MENHIKSLGSCRTTSTALREAFAIAELLAQANEGLSPAGARGVAVTLARNLTALAEAIR